MNNRDEFLMGPIRRLFPSVTLCFVLSWVGCSWAQPKSDSIHYYLLDFSDTESNPSEIKHAGAIRLWLAPIDLPSYLQTKCVAIRSGSNTIAYSDFDQWGERMDQGIARLLEKSLNASPNVLSVTRHRGESTSHQWEVRARVLSCEGTRSGPSTGAIRFKMMWEITSPGGSPTYIHQGQYQAPPTAWNGTNIDTLARQLSAAVAAAAVQLAIEIPQLSPGAETDISPSAIPLLPL